jgi:hypothetical protein
LHSKATFGTKAGDQKSGAAMIETNTTHLDESSPSVQTHINIIQNVIERMAGNSSACKAWCITIVSAVLVVVAKEDKPNLSLITLIPIFLFFVLDGWYLAMERGFRKSYCEFVKKVHLNTIKPDDLYEIKISGDMTELRRDAMLSLSVFGFYIGISILVVVTRFAVLK